MEKKLDNALNELILSIIESEDFKDCIRIREKMNANEEIKKLVDSVKTLQKKYVCTMEDAVKKELEEVQEKLDNIPLYNSYHKKISNVNKKIDYIKEELNDYFYEVVNSEKK